jgi:hypothetical protein
VTGQAVIGEQQIDRVLELLAEHGAEVSVLARLREQLPGIHFTHCADDDVLGPEPVREGETFNLYLVDGREHCLRLTDDPEQATGLLVAELED